MNDTLNDEERLLLLQLIDNNGSVEDLFDLGYKYFQITAFIKTEIANGNAILQNEVLCLSDAGVKEKDRIIENLGLRASGKFVMPKLASKIDNDKMDLSDIFVPSGDDLPF